MGILPLPTLMLLGGLVLGLVLSALARPLARIGARRRREVIARRLRDSVGVVARELVVAPVQAVLDRHRRTRERLDTAARAAPDGRQPGDRRRRPRDLAPDRACRRLTAARLPTGAAVHRPATARPTVHSRRPDAGRGGAAVPTLGTPAVAAGTWPRQMR